MSGKIRVGALISGGGTNLQAIIDACESGTIDGDMVFVGTDNPDAAGLKRAEKHGIPSFIVDYGAIIRAYRENPQNLEMPGDFNYETIAAQQTLMPPDIPEARRQAFIRTRVCAEAALLAEMADRPFDLLVLAGFMRNMTPYFIDRINTDPDRPRIMNIHPALLPSFPGVDGYGDTFRYGCKVGGCTVHFIDYGEDSGPIIGQRAFPIEDSYDLEQVKKVGLAQEWILYPECIQLFAEGRLRLEHREDQRTVVRIDG
jgi:phosphoribosylglycinamide formyltransferase-1